MAPIKYSRVVSFSSEDLVHKVDNLLKPESTRKWKCKTMGEKQATVILQLSKQVQINGVDIGNEYSAFVEVFAAKSSNPDDFKVLLPAVCMMSIQDSKQGIGINNVRFFKLESLLHADESWDRIKVVCTQPYNKCVQYGLAFITVHSASPETKDKSPIPQTDSIETSSQELEASSSEKLGQFVLKDTEETSSISPGSWFSKRKAISPPKEYVKVAKTSLASSIKEDSSPQLVKTVKPKKARKKTDDYCGKIEVTVAASDGSARRATGGPLLYVADEEDDTVKPGKGNSDDNKGSGDSTKESKKPKYSSQNLTSKNSNKPKGATNSSKQENHRDSRKCDLKPVDTKAGKEDGKGSDSQTNRTNSSDSATSSASRKQRKPFDRLLEGVTFVISGFENPLRGDLRSHALEMGAFYKANWDSTCTHLVCAFPNTPKCRSVQKLRGKIVTKDWILDCYNHCKRLPWRRYALLQSDQAYSESEEEIDEEKPPAASKFRLLGTATTSQQSTSTNSQSQTPSTNGLSQPTSKHSQSQGSSVDKQSQSSNSQPKPSSTNSSTTRTNHKVKNELLNSSMTMSKDSPDSTESSHKLGNLTQDSNSDTDIDDDVEFSGSLPGGVFKPLFKSTNFLLHSSLEESMREELFRYITTYEGYCSCEGLDKYTPVTNTNADGHYDYILAETLDLNNKAKYSKSKWIRSEWIWDCIKENRLISNLDYLLS